MSITTVLVANRGEIARRVFASCRRAGIGTVAVFSDADADAPHVHDADIAVRLPGGAASDTYLRSDLIIAAARSAGADAIHPGYGFLSENAAFAAAVEAAGLVWIGPPPRAIELMGSKIEAKKAMDAAGVPVLRQLEPDEVREADLPVLIKASAGGGGRGMRIVRTLAELPALLAEARTEAGSAFGDPTVFCEPYLPTGHHIEVQVMADSRGNVWAVGERECSVQRRHQKVIEEAPSPLVERIGAGMREALFTAAREAASAIGYVGAGTVEFLADAKGGFYFLEMNTRLQVEHPVTELTTGLDLVDLQLQIAEGSPLPETVPSAQGHAIEARLYAEDPANGWQPQSGTLHRFRVPDVSAEFAVPSDSRGLRLDSGVGDGSVVGVHYDPMLAKLISWAPTRREAARQLATAIARAEIHGLVTNRDLLANTLRHPAFVAGDTDISFFDAHGLDELSQPFVAPDAERVSALAAALAITEANRAAAPVLRELPSGWRNIPSQPQRKVFTCRSATYEIRYLLTRDGLTVKGFDTEGLDGERLDVEKLDAVALVHATPDEVTLDIDGVRRTFRMARYGDLVCVDSPLGAVSLTVVPTFADPASAVAHGSLLAPMPGTVTRHGAGVDDRVEAGQPVLWLEAMKMEHVVTAPSAGVLTLLPVGVGEQVEAGAVLAVVTDETDTDLTEGNR